MISLACAQAAAAEACQFLGLADERRESSSTLEKCTLAAKYQAIQDTSERAGDSSVESEEAVDAEKIIGGIGCQSICLPSTLQM